MSLRLDLDTGQFYTIEVPEDEQWDFITTFAADECDRHPVTFAADGGGTVTVDMARVVAIVSPGLEFDDIPRPSWIEA